MKPFLRIFILLALAVSLLGCGNRKSSPTEDNVVSAVSLPKSGDVTDDGPRVNIPDSEFKNYLLSEVVYSVIPFEQGKSVTGVKLYDSVYVPTEQRIDSNGDGEISISEAEQVIFLKVDGLGVKSLEGLESFPNLVGLVVNGVDSPLLDLSNNPQLKHLDCRKCNLSALVLSKNPALKVLYCRGNQLSALDLTYNKALTRLDCANNQISALDLSNNVALEYADCSSNQLATLDVSKNRCLTALYCDYNPLKTLCVAVGQTFGHLSIPEDTTIVNK